MSDVTVIGLGAMGSAIARRFLAEGLTVTAWNRTPAKAQRLVADGAVAVANLSEAIRASQKIVICVIDYTASSQLCEQSGIADALDGRSVIQLTGGTPANAAQADEWMREFQADYLDGAIMCYPADLGGKGSQLLVAGPKADYEKWNATLSCLAQDLRYVGANVRAAKTLDMALLSRFVGLKFSAMHGAHICESEGVGLSELDDFTLRPGSASVDVATAVWAAMQSQAKSRGINSDLPDLFLRWCNAGADKGWGNLDNACLIKVLHGSKGS